MLIDTKDHETTRAHAPRVIVITHARAQTDTNDWSQPELPLARIKKIMKSEDEIKLQEMSQRFVSEDTAHRGHTRARTHTHTHAYARARSRVFSPAAPVAFAKSRTCVRVYTCVDASARTPPLTFTQMTSVSRRV